MVKKHSFPAKIGVVLKSLRETAGIRSQGMTLEQVANAIDFSAAMLGQIEQGKAKTPAFVTVVLLARLYGIHPCGLTTMYPRLTSRHQRAMEHFWTVLTDEQRDDIVGQIELKVADNIDAGELASAIVTGELDSIYGPKLRCHHSDQ